MSAQSCERRTLHCRGGRKEGSNSEDQIGDERHSILYESNVIKESIFWENVGKKPGEAGQIFCTTTAMPAPAGANLSGCQTLLVSLRVKLVFYL